MERNRVQNYAESLERGIQNDYLYLKETTKDFREMCGMVAPGKNVPPEIAINIREVHKEIQNRLTRIKAIQQLLQSKYHKYYRRNPVKDTEFTELAFTANNLFSKFECTLMEIKAGKSLREKERSPEPDHQSESFVWSCSQEDQVAVTKNLTISMIDNKPVPEKIN